ncbi:MAG: hypothetical protein GF315_13145 [candidate division Zixibacteria bacterium]|nr:hypothetical protein [candidate division Zixibacteria bacterium]
MDCRKVYHRLSAYLDKDLLPPDRVQVDEHLRSCDACRKRLDMFRRISVTAQELNELNAPSDVESNVLNAINEYEIGVNRKRAFRDKERFNPRWMFGLSFGVSTAIIIIGIALTTGIFSGQTQYVDNSGVLPAAETGSLDKSELLLDDLDGVVRVVQDLQGDRYIVSRFNDFYYRTGTSQTDTLYTSPSTGNEAMMSVGAEIIF